ncbi:hypothetical protein M426DRAFT_17749 [Hypoxylon sp. CI-4A]|nr:hypothetical protein M426DRAFT_17749 [Hypoxylon sp. CI-4A]
MSQPEKYQYYDYGDSKEMKDGRFNMYRVLIDSDEGRAFEKLSTDSERLDFMRKHAHGSWVVVRSDSCFIEDLAAGKKYVIKIDTPEYEGLQKFLQEDGDSWPPGTKEFDAMFQYYKEHASSVHDVPVNTEPCELGSDSE